MNAIPFVKMHGLGNDFVVIDNRSGEHRLGAAQARAIGDRRRGVGFDQLLILEPPPDAHADVFMRIRNPDGSEAQACGNGTRCVAACVMEETNRDKVVVQTVAGLLAASRDEDGHITVDMGRASLDWAQIPLAHEADTSAVDVGDGSLGAAVCVNIGNPHAVFFVDDAEAVDVEGLGPGLETDELFPEGANIEFTHVVSPNRLRMRVWERGAGVTQACGSGACATAVAAHRTGLAGRRSEIILDGGSLFIEWREDGHVLMNGPAATSFWGMLSAELLAPAEASA